MPAATPIRAHGIVRAHGPRTVLDGVDLTVGATARIALVGPNGSGKSTLLRILAGVEPADAGRVDRHGTVGYLPQLAGDGRTEVKVGELILERVGVVTAARELERLEARLAGGDLEAVEPHAGALERWLALGGDDAEARLGTAADRLGLDPELLGRPLGALSGGQAARAGLAALAVARTDVVLLDEPTNHLDADGLERLVELLAEHAGAAVVVSHDRALLAEACDTVVELEAHGGSATRFGGGWKAYERERRVARERAQAAHDAAVAERERAVAAEREMRRRAAASAGRIASRASDGDKHVREHVRARADGAASRARKVGARAARIAIPDAPWRPSPLRLAVDAGDRGGGAVVELRAAVARRGGWTLGPLDLELVHGDRLLLRGPNGSGKTTLLDLLDGTLDLSGGERRLAPGAVVARLGQHRDGLAADVPLVDALRSITGLDTAAVRTALAAMGLGAHAAARGAATLSPGERTRAELVALAQAGARCLLLDEPTNHLDVESLELLEQVLDGWPGALVVATHDRRLVEGLAVTATLELGGVGRPRAVPATAGGRKG